MSVQIQGLTARSTVSEPGVRGGTGLELYGAFGVYTLTLGTRTYVYVAAHEDHGLSVFRLGADGSLTSVQNLSDSGSTTNLELVGASQITSATLASGTYLYVNSAIDDGLSVFKVDTATGKLTSIQNITDTTAIELNGPEGKMQVATVGGNTYLISPADDDNGIATWRINANGTLTNVFNLTDNATLQLHSASDAEVVVVGTHTYVYVAAEDDPGISVFELKANGTLTNIQNIHDDATLQLDGTAGLAVATVGTATYVIASGAGVLNSNGVPQSPEGLSVFSVGSTGQLKNVFNLHDTAELGLFGAFGLTTFTIDTVAYVAVSAITDDALSIFRVEAGGALTEVTTVFDSAGVTLDRSYFNDFVTVGGKHFLLATGRSDNGVTAFEVILDGTSSPITRTSASETLTGTAGADEIWGRAGNDTLKGLGGNDKLYGEGGNDILKGQNGADTLTGGAGLDQFVFLAGANSKTTGMDHILDFTPGEDKIVVTNIDANTALSGNQAFVLDDNTSFSAGEIRQGVDGDSLVLEFNVDADATVEMAIVIDSRTSLLSASDFEL